MNNFDQQPAIEVSSAKKEYNAPSVLEFGDITNLVNGDPTTGGDGSGNVNNSQS